MTARRDKLEAAVATYKTLTRYKVINFISAKESSWRSIDPVIDMLKQAHPEVRVSIGASYLTFKVKPGGYSNTLRADYLDWHEACLDQMISDMVGSHHGCLNLGEEGFGGDRDTLVRLYSAWKDPNWWDRLWGRGGRLQWSA